MKVIPPLAISDAIFTSSTVAEPASGETAWVSGTTTYTVGTVVIRTSTHRKYECLIAPVTPFTVPPETDVTHWLDIGPTNKWAMVDLLRNSVTTGTSPLTTVFTPGVRINSLAVLNTNADNISVTATSVAGGGTVFTYSASLIDRRSTGWYDYFFDPIDADDRNCIMFDIPPFTDVVLTVTQTKGTGDVECGALVIGNFVNIGKVQYSATNDAVGFSTVDRDDFGNATMVQRRSVPKTTQELFLEQQYIDKVIKLRETLDATPAVWSGQDDDVTSDLFESLLILGFYRTFSINIDTPLSVKINLELEEI